VNTDNLPLEFREKLNLLVPSEKLQEVLLSFCSEKPVSFRANTLKISTTQVKEQLETLGIEYKQVPWYQDAFVLVKEQKEELTKSLLFQNGLIYVQNLSSMIPALVLNPKPGELVCDLTAAPGSKTTQMAALMQNQGLIVANDISRVRIFKMKSILQIQGVSNVEVTSIPGQVFWRKYPNHFDKTLVDVPCSMEGRFLCSDSKSFGDWSVRKVKKLSEEQKYLLWSAISATKPGGAVVYSTCTLSPEENEEVIDWILKKEKGIVIEKIDLDVDGKIKPITEWGNKKYDPQVSNCLRILPTELMEGFFVAKLRKET
jgi:NOL1/NOP2/sun family putative RNA methylase